MGLGIHTVETFVEFFVVDAGIMLGTHYGGRRRRGTNSLAAPCGFVLTIFPLFFFRHPTSSFRVVPKGTDDTGGSAVTEHSIRKIMMGISQLIKG